MKSSIWSDIPTVRLLEMTVQHSLRRTPRIFFLNKVYLRKSKHRCNGSRTRTIRHAFHTYSVTVHLPGRRVTANVVHFTGKWAASVKVAAMPFTTLVDALVCANAYVYGHNVLLATRMLTFRCVPLWGIQFRLGPGAKEEQQPSANGETTYPTESPCSTGGADRQAWSTTC